MAIKINKKYMTKNDCYKSGVKINPKGVMWHSTAATEGEQVNSDYYFDRWNKAGVKKCVHAFLDEQSVTEMLPTEKNFCFKGWHCGDDMNKTHIGFEIIEPKDYKDKSYFEKIYENAIQYTVVLFNRFGWDKVTEENLLCHSEGYIKFKKASNHADIMHWFKYHGVTMDDVRKEVQKRLDSQKSSSTPVVSKTIKATMYTTDNLNCRVSGNASAKLLGTFKKDEKLTINYQKGDTWYKATGIDKKGKTISGYVCAKYLTSTEPVSTKTMTTTANLNCRTKGNTSGKIVGTFAKGAKIKVTYKKGDTWYKASGVAKNKKSIVGYVHSDYLK